MLRLPRAKGAGGRRWNNAAGMRKRVAVVMCVRVNVRMRVGRVGKRMWWVLFFIGDGGGL